MQGQVCCPGFCESLVLAAKASFTAEEMRCLLVTRRQGDIADIRYFSRHCRGLLGPTANRSQCSAADCVLIFIGAAACTAPKFCNFTEANMCVLSLVQCAAQHRHQTILM